MEPKIMKSGDTQVLTNILESDEQMSRSNWNDPFSPSSAIYNAAPFYPHLEDPS